MKSPSVRADDRIKLLRRDESRNRADFIGAAAVVLLPFSIIIVRLGTSSGHIYLSDDLATLDLNVRTALHFRQQLGMAPTPYGFSHPGPAYFYILSLIARCIGSGARADFVGAAVVNGVCGLGTVWLVRRRAGPLPALWAALCLAYLALILTSSTSPNEDPAGVFVSPWNPDGVIFPLVLFGSLCVAGAVGSSVSLIGAAVVGSVVIQSNLGTIPVVSVLMFVALIASCVRAVITKNVGSAPRNPFCPAEGDSSTAHRFQWLTAAGIALLILIWLPPLLQELATSPGNLTLIWRFVVHHHTTQSWNVGLWSIVTIDGMLMFGFRYSAFGNYEVGGLGSPPHHALFVLAAVLLIGILAVALGIVLRRPFAAGLGVISLVGFLVNVFAATRIVGPVSTYLIVWEVAMPALGIVGLGIAALPGWDELRQGSREEGRNELGFRMWGASYSESPLLRNLPRVATWGLGCVLTSLLLVKTVDLPLLGGASYPPVAAASTLITAHLHASESKFRLAFSVPSNGFFKPSVYIGVFDELNARGLRPCMTRDFAAQFAERRYVCPGNVPVSVEFVQPSPAVEHMVGYLGHLQWADILLVHGHSQPGPGARG